MCKVTAVDAPAPRLAAGGGCPVGHGEIGLKPDLRGAVPITPLLGLGGDSPPLLAEWGLAFIPLLSEEGCPVGAGWLPLTFGFWG